MTHLSPTLSLLITNLSSAAMCSDSAAAARHGGAAPTCPKEQSGKIQNKSEKSMGE